MESEIKQVKWYWPTISDISGAIAASDQGVWGAVLVAAFTAMFATIALFTNSDIAFINAWAYIDAAAFGMIAWRIRRRSKFFAVAGLCLFIFEKAVQFSDFQINIPTLFMAGLFLVLFINGVRGTFAFHRLSGQIASEPVVEDVSPVAYSLVNDEDMGVSSAVVKAELIEKGWLYRTIRLKTTGGFKTLTYYGRGAGYECVLVNSEVVSKNKSLLWYTPEFRLRVDSMDVVVNIRVWPWLTIRKFWIEVDSNMVYAEGYLEQTKHRSVLSCE